MPVPVFSVSNPVIGCIQISKFFLSLELIKELIVCFWAYYSTFLHTMKFLTFDELWAMGNSGSIGGNTLYYHPCCDVWTSKAAKSKRASHAKYLRWGEILLTLDKNIEDKKQALQAKMIEDNMTRSIILNQRCKHNLGSVVGKKSRREAVEYQAPPPNPAGHMSDPRWPTVPKDSMQELDLGTFYVMP